MNRTHLIPRQLAARRFINNSNKYERAKLAAGENATTEQILAQYDKLAGLIKNEVGEKIENGRFWEEEKKVSANNQKTKDTWGKRISIIGKITNNQTAAIIIGGIILLIIIYLIYAYSGINLSQFD